MPFLSIIVPIYKVERYLSKCIDSILRQNFSDYELILVDDGSPDNCPSICDGYLVKDERIRVVHKANGGLSSARNAGLDIAKGKYVSFIDSDDWISTDFYDILKSLNSIKPDTIFIPYSTVFSDHSVDVNYGTMRTINEKNEIYKFYFGKSHNLSVWKCIFKRELFDDLRFKDGHLFEDCFLATEITPLINSILVSDIGCYYYLMRSGSICNSSVNLKIVKQHLYAYQQIIEFFLSKGLPSQYYSHFYTTYLYNLLKGCKQIENPNFNLNNELSFWKHSELQCFKNFFNYSLKAKILLVASYILGVKNSSRFIK